MNKERNILVNSDSGYKVTLNQQNDDIQKIFSKFNEDFEETNISPTNENKNYLTTSVKTERRNSRVKNKDTKRMKLIDYIYIKNTAKKNQQSKTEKAGMSTNQLRKSRMKEGKQKAFRIIVEQMVGQLQQISSKTAVMSELIQDRMVYTGNTDEITKLCNIRRIIKQNILGNLAELQKLIGIQNLEFETKSKIHAQLKKEEDVNQRVKRFQQLGVKRLNSEANFFELNPEKSQRGEREKQIRNKKVIKDIIEQ